MSIKKVDGLAGIVGFKFILAITLLYFVVVFPGIQFFLRGHAWIPQYGYVIYFAGVLAYVLPNRAQQCLTTIELRYVRTS